VANESTWQTERVGSFAEISERFLEQVFTIVWCNVATVDSKGRPRSRILHPWWETNPRPTGWILTGRSPLKVNQLAKNPFVSCAYVADIARAVYADCQASWVDDPAEKERIWHAFLAAPDPMGYDPAGFFGAVDNPALGLLRLDPWRIQVEQVPPRIRQVWTP
jgi:general stress protein 26